MLRISSLLLFSVIAFGLVTLLLWESDKTEFSAGINHASFVTSASLEDLTAKSSIIAIGTVRAGKPTIRHIQGGDPDNSSQPELGFVGVGSVYQVNVERYLKGNGDGTLPVVQFESIIADHQGQMIQVRTREADFPLNKGTRYLLFLRPQAQAPDLLIGTAEPSRFVLSSGLARVETPADGLEVLFPDSSESDLVARVENIVNGG